MKGFTLIEILISIAILLLLIGISLGFFVALDQEKALSASTLVVRSVLSEARSKTVSSEGGYQYGVHFDASANKIIRFRGDTYTAGDAHNISTSLHSVVEIVDTSLASGGSSIVFERISGATEDHGSVVLQAPDGDGGYSRSTTTIYATGVVE